MADEITGETVHRAAAHIREASAPRPPPHRPRPRLRVRRAGGGEVTGAVSVPYGELDGFSGRRG